MFNLPRNVLQFLINSAINTLPTNSNLVRWKKRSSPACNLCQNRETLLHTLNNCTSMLNDGRYTWRHNSILDTLATNLKAVLPETEKLFCDLPGKLIGISTIPTDICITNLKPDLVIVNYEKKLVTLIELTVPFDSNILAANKRKTKRYEQLISDIENNDFEVNFYALEISSRGYVSPDNSQRLKSIMTLADDSYSKKQLRALRQSLQKISIICSYCIFYSKFEKNWINPPFVSI